MSRPQHTPGPWAVTTVGSCHGVHPAASSDERDDICRITPHNYHPDGWPAAKAEAEANARLIAASPELLAALDGLLGATVDRMLADGYELDGVEYAARLAALAAIAKATGGKV